MYDGSSLKNKLIKSGFSNAKIMNAGDTTIANPGELDLYERSPESVFVEAIKL